MIPRGPGMSDVGSSISTDPYVLMEIIRMQTEIAKLGLDLGGVVSLVVDRVQTLTNAAGAIVQFAEGDDMVYRGVSGIARPLLGLRIKRQGSLSGLCVREGQVLRADDTEIDPRVDRDSCRKVGLRSMVVAPLNHNETTVGALMLASPAANAFTDRDVRVLELMSELIAAAMYHAARNETNELYHQATHDSLTGLANRAAFYDRLRQRLSTARRQSDNAFGILMIDMDGLKAINDRYGHRTGDAALCETARRINLVSRESDMVCRIGGDEFGVILPEIQGREDGPAIADRISCEICQPFQFEKHELFLNASIGIAIYPADGSDIDQLIEAADQSMYAVKRTRTGRQVWQ
jgi:diguanylate cyclase (GGDEF)-like protein